MNTSVRSLLINSWWLLTGRQRVLAIFVVGTVFVAGTLEMVVLSSAIPLVSLIVSPQLVEQNVYLAALSNWLGSPPVNRLILWIGTGVAVMLVVGVVANLFAQYLIHWFGARVATRLAQEVFDQCLRAPYSWFLRQNGPHLAQRLAVDSSAVGLVLYPVIVEWMYTTFIMIAAGAIIVILSPWQGLVAVGVIVIFAILILTIVRPWVAKYSTLYRDRSMESTQIGINAFAGIKELMVKARQKYFQNLYGRIFRAMVQSRTKLNLLQQCVPIVIVLIGQLGLVTIALALHASNMSAGEMSGLLTLLVLMTGRLVPAISRMFGTINKLTAVIPNIEGYQELRRDLDRAHKEIANSQHRPPVPTDWRELEFRAVSFSYSPSEEASLHNVTLSLKRGGAYGIVGPSGAGKTTLVDLLLGLLRPQSGTIAVDGRRLDGFSAESWLRRVGYVPQAPFLINDTLRRNVALAVRDNEIDDEKVLRSLKLAGLGGTVEKLHQGLDTQMGDRGTRLSGGQAQRVAIARALYDDPVMLVLDEATSALDMLTEQALKQTIAKLHGEITTVTIAHRMSTIEHCDCVFVLDRGQLVAAGTFLELEAGGGIFAAMNEAGEAPLRERVLR